MKKSKAIVLLCILLIIVAVLGVFAFLPFKINEKYDYVSALGGIKLGVDLKGGVYVVLEAEKNEDGELIDKEGNVIADDSDVMDTFKENIDKSIEILSKRLADKGYTEATVVKQGSDKIRVEIPDVEDPEAVFAIIGKPADLEFRAPDKTTVLLTGSDVEKAHVSMNENGAYIVSLKFTKEGTKKFATATQTYLNQTIGIYVDGELKSDPKINEVITGGQASIEGNFTYETAKDLASSISSGALPIVFTTAESKVMSATLGEDAINTSLLASIIGLGLVIVFMCVWYRGFGIIASISLITYTIIDLFLLALLPWVQLTLPGVAGIVLSIGMAVDANIIIIERTKDEYRSGKTLQLSTQIGFKKAFSAILDGNITTIIAAAVLWIFGAGIIKGFAITLFIGIIVSLFSSLVVSRIFTKLFLPLTKNEKFYGVKREVKTNEEA